VEAKIIELDTMDDEHELEEEMMKITGKNQIPSIFIGGHYFGGNTEL
jgi:glutaredoxin